ncbi:MAG: T9SS type A sorting domain-containing protein [Balneolaceae bacterium]|nr:T9SS type A sorting domain-containing protein [Balneolaceae bacterium]MBO6545320.1 T9SS type A sorting domain-containing protein [Balneolaceae bacterium]MBO6646716.1 T9SS type A sorting domain-containing protein [Balneolaceae bacterium]
MKSLHLSFFGVLLLSLLFITAQAQTVSPGIAVGENQSLVLTDNGTVYTFGEGTHGTLGQGNGGRYDIAAPITHSNLGGKKIIAAAVSKDTGGDEFTLMIAEDSTVYSFGENNYGQLGHDDKVSRRDPTQISHANITGKKFVAVSAGKNFSVLLAHDGSVFVMGHNNNGYLGIGSTTPGEILVPTLVDTSNISGHRIVQIAAGNNHTIMLSDSNQVFAFGENVNGQLGDSTRVSKISPVKIPKSNFANKTITDIEAGVGSSLVLTTDGTIYSWGNFRAGLGHGTLASDLLTPTAISHANLSGKMVTKISKTHETGLLLASDGTLFIFGDDFGFTISDFPTEYTSSATLGKTISDISIGKSHGLLQTADGLVYGFGSGSNGNHGVGTILTINHPRPINNSFISGKVISSVAAGAIHSIIIDSAGVAYSFGGTDQADYSTTSNSYLGRSYDRLKSTPTQLSHSNIAGKNIVAVKAGGLQSFLLTDEGKVYGFGSNRFGELGFEDSVDVYVPTLINHTNLSGKKVIDIASTGEQATSAHSGHTLLLTEDGSIYAFGRNVEGQLGLGDFNNRRVPTQITHSSLSGKTITDIAVGANNSLAMASDGSVFIWGSGKNGAMGFGNTDTLNVPTLATHLTSLGKTFIDAAIGGSNNTIDPSPHFLFIASDSSVYSFGEGSDGQLGLGNKTDNYVPTQITSSNISGKKPIAVAAGVKTSMLLMNDGSVFSFGNTHTVGFEGSSFTDLNVPTLLNNAEIYGKRALAITTNRKHSLALLDEGTVLSFGLDSGTITRLGALGNGLPESGDETPQPIANFNWLTSPIPTTNLALHLDAGRGITAFGDTLNTWKDLSGNDNDGFENNSIRKPMVADSVINNQRAVRFNGSNWVTLPTASTLGIQNSDYEVFIVAKSATSHSSTEFLIAGSSERYELHVNGAAGARFIPTASTYIDIGTAGNFTDSTAQLFNARATSTQAVLSVNRSSTELSVDAHSADAETLYLGVRADNSGFLNGDIAEVIIYTDILSDNDRRKVESYLFKKYAIQNYKESSQQLTGVEGWRILTSPVADSSFAPLLDDLWTQGFTGADHSGGVSNVYRWPNTTTDLSNTNWTSVNNMSDSLHPGEGVLVYVFSDDNGPGVAGDAGFPKTLQLEGREPTGTQSLTSLLNSNVNGWALVGNPFRKDVDWDSFLRSNLSNSVYVYDTNTSGWKSWNGTLGSLSDGEVGAFNAFFVQTTGVNPSLEIPESAKTDSANSFLGKAIAKANPFYFSLELKSDSGFTNKVWFQFSEEGELGIDESDAYQLNPLSPNYVTIASVLNDTTHLDISSLPIITQKFDVSLALQTTHIGIEHTIIKGDLNIPEGWEIILHDSELDITTDLSEAYAFKMGSEKVKKQNLASPPSMASIFRTDKQKKSGARFKLTILPEGLLSNGAGAQLKITGSQGWRLLSSPVADSSFASLLDDLWTQGFTGADHSGGASNVYRWPKTSTNLSDTNWTSVNNMSNSLHPGEGILVYVFSDDNGPETPGDNGFPKTIKIEGNAPKGTQNYTSLLNQSLNGWALIGNPFRNDIDWDGFNRSGLSNSIYVYDINTSAWKSWNGALGSLTDGEIGAFNAFFVQTTGVNPSLEIPESAKTDSAKRFLGKRLVKPDPIYFSLELKSDSGYTNKVWFQFSEEGEFGIDESDAYQFNPFSVNYVTMASILNDTTHLDINSLPVISKPLEVPLALKATNSKTKHQISLKDLNLPDGWEVGLYDSKLETTSDFSEPYTFTMGSAKVKKPDDLTPESLLITTGLGKSTEIAPRFILTINPATSVNGEPFSDIPEEVELSQNYPNPFNPASTIAFGVPKTNQVRLEIFDVLGRKVASLIEGETLKAGRYQIRFDARNLASGMYIYRLNVGNKTLTKKMTLIK